MNPPAKSTSFNKIVSLATFCLFLSVSLVPLNFLPFKIAGVPFHYFYVGGIVLLLIAFSFCLESKITRFDKWLILLIAGFSLSLISSIDVDFSIQAIISFILRGFGIAFVTERMLASKTTSAKLLLICASIVSVISLIEYFFRFNPYFGWTDLPDYFIINYPVITRNGMAGTIGHPLALSAYLIMFLPLSIWYIRGNNLILKFLPLILILSAIFLSFSRSSWIIAALMLATYVIFRKKNTKFGNKRKIILLFLILIMAIFGIFRLKNYYPERTNIGNFLKEFYQSHRSASYTTTLNILKKYPFFGVGLGNYPAIHEQYRATGTKPELKTPDNMYLRFLCETGIAGTSVFLIFIFYWFLQFWKHRDSDFVFALSSGLAGFLLNQLVADLFYWLAPQFTFWMLLGIAVSNINNNSNKNNQIQH